MSLPVLHTDRPKSYTLNPKRFILIIHHFGGNVKRVE